MDWPTGLLFVLLGVSIGALGMYFLRHRFDDTDALRRKLADLTSESEAFRNQVDEHFRQTSELFEEVTDKYRHLYDHLARGATGLTRNPEQRPSLAIPERALLDGEAGVDAGSTVESRVPLPGSGSDAVERGAAERVAQQPPGPPGAEASGTSAAPAAQAQEAPAAAQPREAPEVAPQEAPEAAQAVESGPRQPAGRTTAKAGGR